MRSRNDSCCSIHSEVSQDEDNLEIRIDTWLTNLGVYPDDPTSKQASYFSAKRSKISSVVLKSEFVGSRGTTSSPERRSFHFGDLEIETESGPQLEMVSPLFSRRTNIEFGVSGDDQPLLNGVSPRHRTTSMRDTFVPELPKSSLFARRLGNNHLGNLQTELLTLDVFAVEPEPVEPLSRSSISQF